jgi:hypothetical protein
MRSLCAACHNSLDHTNQKVRHPVRADGSPSDPHHHWNAGTQAKESNKMTDIVTKLLLAAIALALWVNAAQIARPTHAYAQAYNADVHKISAELDVLVKILAEIAGGNCHNPKLCY